MLTISDLYDRYRHAVRTEGINSKWANHYGDRIAEWEEQTGHDAIAAVYGHMVQAHGEGFDVDSLQVRCTG